MPIVGEVFNPFRVFTGLWIPNSVARYSRLLPTSKLVFGRLLQYAGARGTAWPTQEELADELNISPRNIRRCLQQLEDEGFIRAFRFGLNRPNEYEFLWHECYEDGYAEPPQDGLGDDQDGLSGPDNMSYPDRTPVSAPDRTPTSALIGRRCPILYKKESEEESEEENHMGGVDSLGSIPDVVRWYIDHGRVVATSTPPGKGKGKWIEAHDTPANRKLVSDALAKATISTKVWDLVLEVLRYNSKVAPFNRQPIGPPPERAAPQSHFQPKPPRNDDWRVAAKARVLASVRASRGGE